MNFEKLIKVLEKEIISGNELKGLVNEELVESVSVAKQDNRHKNHLKYGIKLENGELHYVYVKK